MPESYVSIFWIVLATLWGLLIGSFLNVCIFRLPRRETIVRGHSYCPSCHHPLNGLDLVPIVSYLFLGRRCRYCRQPISGRYALIEAWAGLYSFLAAWLWRSGSSLVNPSSSLLALSDVWQPVLLSLSAMFTVYLLIVWAMILYDGHQPPPPLYWLAAPALILHWLIHPERAVFQLIAGLVVIAAMLSLAKSTQYGNARSSEDRALIISTGSGLAVIVLFGGAPAGLAAVMTGLALLLVTGTIAKKQTHLPLRPRRLTAPLMLIAGSLAWLLF